MNIKRATAAIIFALALPPAQAEILHDIEPLSSLGDIKRQYPNATFTKETVAWVQEWQAFYSMTGSGFPGKLYLTFRDSRPHWRSEYQRLTAQQTEGTNQARSAYAVMAGQLASRGDDQALEIDWVRWIPDNPIPMARVQGRYGPPAKCGFSDSDFTPYCSWPLRALSAVTSDDHKFVSFITAGFTNAEMRAAYKARGLTVPEKYLPTSNKR